MRAAMPHLDRLLPGNTIASLEQLADLMEGELGVKACWELGLVLAAGEGGRFGGPKQLARVDGRPLIEHALAALAGLDRVVVVLGARADEIRAGADLSARRGRRLRGLGRRAWARRCARARRAGDGATRS